MKIRSILVPTDFGPSADAAWRFAQDLARRYGSRLHLLHVLAVPPFVEDPLGTQALSLSVADLLRDAGHEATLRLGRIRVAPALARKTTRSTAEGAPVDSILAFVQAHRIELVVMGTHGRGPIKHVLLGSVAERVVRHSPVPVLTVRAATSSGTP